MSRPECLSFLEPPLNSIPPPVILAFPSPSGDIQKASLVPWPPFSLALAPQHFPFSKVTDAFQVARSEGPRSGPPQPHNSRIWQSLSLSPCWSTFSIWPWRYYSPSCFSDPIIGHPPSLLWFLSASLTSKQRGLWGTSSDFFYLHSLPWRDQPAANL